MPRSCFPAGAGTPLKCERGSRLVEPSEEVGLRVRTYSQLAPVAGGGNFASDPPIRAYETALLTAGATAAEGRVAAVTREAAPYGLAGSVRRR